MAQAPQTALEALQKTQVLVQTLINLGCIDVTARSYYLLLQQVEQNNVTLSQSGS